LNLLEELPPNQCGLVAPFGRGTQLTPRPCPRHCVAGFSKSRILSLKLSLLLVFMFPSLASASNPARPPCASEIQIEDSLDTLFSENTLMFVATITKGFPAMEFQLNPTALKGNPPAKGVLSNFLCNEGIATTTGDVVLVWGDVAGDGLGVTGLVLAKGWLRLYSVHWSMVWSQRGIDWIQERQEARNH
jgi:hypothetical protein